MSTTITASSEKGDLQELLSALVLSSANEEAPPGEQTQDDISSVASTNSSPSLNDDANNENSKTQEFITDFDKICRYLDQEEWTFTPKRERGLIISSGTGSNGTYQMIIDVKEEDSILIVYVRLPAKVPQNKRLDIAEFITRANYGLMISNFELDFSDGDCRCKGSIDYTGGALSNGMIEELIGKTAYTMNRYFPGMMRVIYGNVNPKSAIAEIEPSQSRGDTGEALAELLVQALTSAGEEDPTGSESVSDGDTPVAIATPTP